MYPLVLSQYIHDGGDEKKDDGKGYTRSIKYYNQKIPGYYESS
jgi:hypothetical protein